jgi:hypothetical protein
MGNEKCQVFARKSQSFFPVTSSILLMVYLPSMLYPYRKLKADVQGLRWNHTIFAREESLAIV